MDEAGVLADPAESRVSGEHALLNRAGIDIAAGLHRNARQCLESGFDRLPLQSSMPLDLPQQHSNVRGPDYYRSDQPSHTNPNGD